ncbi:hypothetical protein D3C73_681750 [compost metagenome]
MVSAWPLRIWSAVLISLALAAYWYSATPPAITPRVTSDIGLIMEVKALTSAVPTFCPLLFICSNTAESCVPCCSAICMGDMPIAAVTPISWNCAAMFDV